MSQFFPSGGQSIGFCVAILILKMEEKEQRCWHILLYYFKKGKKKKLKRNKRFVLCMEKVLSNMSKEVCKVSYWRFLA